ncbi:MAG: DNA repair protein RecO, partial [Acetanaerobacterium sp.]
MQISTEGVVLRVRDVDEADRVLTILTRERGVICAFANGSKRFKSKLMASTQTFTYSQFQLYKRKDYYTVDSAEPVTVFYGIRNDMDRLALAGYLCELAQSLAPEEDEAEGFLRLLLNCLYFLDKGLRDPLQLKALFELRIVAMAGYMPNLVGCAECGCFEAERMFFYINSAKLVCPSCAHTPFAEQVFELPAAVLAAMRYIIYSELDKLFSFAIAKQSLALLVQVCEAYALCRIGHSFKTLDFLNALPPGVQGQDPVPG